MEINKDVILFALAFLGLFSIFQRLANTHDLCLNRQFLGVCDCGESVAETISRGCKFDSLAKTLLPEHCQDDELTAEFNTACNGPNGTIWIPGLLISFVLLLHLLWKYELVSYTLETGSRILLYP
jgi:hypothetical protein